MRRLTILFLAITCVSVGLVGCGREAASDSQMKCSDFMSLSKAKRDDAVTRVASEMGNPDAVTPLGRPNIEYLCTQAPDYTLGQVVGMTTNSPQSATTTASVETQQATPTTPLIRLVTEWKTQGYTIKAQTDVTNIRPTIDTASAPLGFANVYLYYDLSLVLTNQTPGHKAPTNGKEVGIEPIYPKGSAVCKAMETYAPTQTVASFCGGYERRFPAFPNSSIIDKTGVVGGLPSGTDVVMTFQTFLDLRNVPEDQAETVRLQLATPTGWVMSSSWPDQVLANYPCKVEQLRVTASTVGISACKV